MTGKMKTAKFVGANFSSVLHESRDPEPKMRLYSNNENRRFPQCNLRNNFQKPGDMKQGQGPVDKIIGRMSSSKNRRNGKF